MKISYNEIYSENVFDNLEAGNRLIMCDFSAMAMVDCTTLKVSQLQYYVGKDGVKFFREIAANE